MFCVFIVNVAMYKYKIYSGPMSSSSYLLLDLKNAQAGLFDTELSNTGNENVNDPTANTYSRIGILTNNASKGRDGSWTCCTPWMLLKNWSFLRNKINNICEKYINSAMVVYRCI